MTVMNWYSLFSQERKYWINLVSDFSENGLAFLRLIDGGFIFLHSLTILALYLLPSKRSFYLMLSQFFPVELAALFDAVALFVMVFTLGRALGPPAGNQPLVARLDLLTISFSLIPILFSTFQMFVDSVLSFPAMTDGSAALYLLFSAVFNRAIRTEPAGRQLLYVFGLGLVISIGAGWFYLYSIYIGNVLVKVMSASIAVVGLIWLVGFTISLCRSVYRSRNERYNR